MDETHPQDTPLQIDAQSGQRADGIEIPTTGHDSMRPKRGRCGFGIPIAIQRNSHGRCSPFGFAGAEEPDRVLGSKVIQKRLKEFHLMRPHQIMGKATRCRG